MDMPLKALKICNHRVCDKLTRNTYCEQHEKAPENIRKYHKPDYKKLYHSTLWRKNRVIFLKRNPLCVLCEQQGRLKPATIVDHIKPHKGNYELFIKQSNWQALCKICHDYKTGKYDSNKN